MPGKPLIIRLQSCTTPQMISQHFKHLPKAQANNSHPKFALGEGWLFPEPRDDTAGHSKAGADIEWDQNKYYNNNNKKKKASDVSLRKFFT